MVASLIKLLFPARCACCGAVAGGSDVCVRCKEKITYINPPVCELCGSELKRCGCKNRKYAFDRAVSAIVYEGAVRNGIRRFKFEGKVAAGRFFADEMLRVISREYGDVKFGLLLAVPMSKLSLKRRGYNHCDILCGHISKKTGIEFDRRALTKLRESRQQHTLSWRERMTNLSGVFRADSKKVAGKTVLLADDIMTTGATLSECARAIKNAGAKEVFCVSAAMTELNRIN